jgi:uncharacterized damage-inducible protein DinB
MTDREFYTARWSAELPITLAMLSALPDGKLDYQPHPKCRTARSIVGHLLSHVDAINDLLAAGGASHHRLELPFKDVADATEQMRRSGAVTATRLAGVAENTWNTMNNRLLVGEHVHFEAPLGFTAWIMLFDIIHHRGQLSSYVRPMGGKHPDIYGSSGDSEPQH